jgi:AcrR family transcriptional regulator
MEEDGKHRRGYHAPRREAAAARTREAIVRAAKQLFEERGWAATTVRSIAHAAGVSPKTVEADFATKAALLEAAVAYAIRGDLDPQPVAQREAITQVEQAPDAATMLTLHAAHLRRVHERSAHIARAVEQAAAADPIAADRWQEMNRNRSAAISRATETLLEKPGCKPGLTRQDVRASFWIALDWATYRTLTEQARLTPDQYEAWLRRYYAATFLES